MVTAPVAIHLHALHARGLLYLLEGAGEAEVARQPHCIDLG